MAFRDGLSIFVVLSLLVNVSYLRGFELVGPITTSYLVIVWLLIGLALVAHQLLRARAIVVTDRWWLWCGLVGWVGVSFLYNVVFRPEPALAIRFTVEFSLSLLLFVCLIYLLDKWRLKTVYRGFVGFSAVFGLLLTLYPFLAGFESVRRVGGYQTPGAVNNISQMIGIGIVLATVGLLYADSYHNARLELVSLPPLFSGLILTGSRAAVLGVGVALVTLFITSDQVSFRVLAFTSVVGATVLAALTALYQLSVFYRYSPDFLIYSAVNRTVIYTKAIRQSGYGVFDILFGGGMYRYSEIALGIEGISTIVYPHNYVISLLVHIGLPAAILFSVLLLWNARSLLYWCLSDAEESYVTVSTLLALEVVVLYAFTSGRVTRTFPLWIMLAISEYLYIANGAGNEGTLLSLVDRQSDDKTVNPEKLGVE